MLSALPMILRLLLATVVVLAAIGQAKAQAPTTASVDDSLVAVIGPHFLDNSI